MLNIAHIINPVDVPPSSELHLAQRLARKAMRTAKLIAQDSVNVTLYTAQYPEDRGIVPEYFTKTPDLGRSILDVLPFRRQKKLPLFKDILDRLYAASDAEYFVYTNADIILMPQFYTTVQWYINMGCDALVINRRTVPEYIATTEEDLPGVWSAVGKPHPGYDCFVFSRSLYPQCDIGTVCLGAPAVDVGLLLNMMACAKRFLLLKHEHLTCHIGNDKQWTRQQFDEFAVHNLGELARVWRYLEETLTKRYGSHHTILTHIRRDAVRKVPYHIVTRTT
ncbi:hypothetical protein COU80_04595 [Candidatus Peregrinibacteria bacterium CG10_big_fil_rev_8_21_14_0_10_55_24]|nr:MAG: hypothetical protein COU80_04595 [Candidatus Peregrinibacteria bacterium CG10_big_fil_rev_8_21_14_0_10_55_24]